MFRPTTKVKRSFLSLRNKGDKAVDTTPVHASISFYNTDCDELTALSHEKPFWFNFKPRVERKLAEDHNVIIKANGEPEGVCLIIRRERTDDLFVFNDDSYAPGTPSIDLMARLRIPNSKVYIRVKLSAANFKKDYVFWVSLVNKGKGADPELKILDQSPCGGLT